VADEMNIASSILPVFATPIVNYRWEDMDSTNAELEQLVLSESATTTGMVKSNVGGWHSGLDFIQREEDCVAKLRARLLELSRTFCAQILRQDSQEILSTLRLEGWANVIEYGQYHTLHCHPNAFWSGVYYVNGNDIVEGHDFSGKLELMDPRPGANLSYSEKSNLYGRFLLNPSDGQVILFPSWLQHQVHPYFGESKRVSVAFNILLGG